MYCSCDNTERHSLCLTYIESHDAETYSFYFEANEFNWREGDSSKFYIPVLDGEISKTFSHANLASERLVRFTTRIREKASFYKLQLAKLKIGDVIEMSVPSGQFALRRIDKPIFLLSNGVGLAAYRPHILEYAENQRGIPALIQLNVDRSSRLYESEFAKIASEVPTFSSVFSPNRENFFKSLDYMLQSTEQEKYVEPLIYVVGSDLFVKSTVDHLIDVGYDMDTIVTDGDRYLGGGCGCSSNEGCGCGSNYQIDNRYSSENLIF